MKNQFKRALMVVLSLVIVLSTTIVPAFAAEVSEEVITLEVKGSSLIPYFVLNGEVAFCVSPEKAHPTNGVSYTYETETSIPELEAAVIAAETHVGTEKEHQIYKALQLVIWTKLDPSNVSIYKDRAESMGTAGVKLYNEFNNAEVNSDYSCTFFLHNTKDVAGAGREYQTLATYKVAEVENEPEEVVEEVPVIPNVNPFRYTVRYYLDNVLINEIECLENVVYVTDAIPVQEGYTVSDWVDDNGKEWKEQSTFVNLAGDGEIFNFYAETSRIEEAEKEPYQYVVRYYLDGELLDETTCVEDVVYTINTLPEANENNAIGGWRDDNGENWTENTQFINIAEANGVYNFYAKTLKEEIPEEPVVAGTYFVNYYLDGEKIGDAEIPCGSMHTIRNLPCEEVIVIGWRDDNEKTFAEGEEFMSEEDGFVLNLYAETVCDIDIPEVEIIEDEPENEPEDNIPEIEVLPGTHDFPEEEIEVLPGTYDFVSVPKMGDTSNVLLAAIVLAASAAALLVIRNKKESENR